METGQAAPIEPTHLLRRVRGGLLGVGLFSLHAGLYLIVAFSLFVWKLIETPADLGVPIPQLIIPWGALVLIHAAVVAVFSVLRDVLTPEEEQREVPREPGQVPAASAGAADEPQQQPRRVSRFQPPATSLDDVRNGGQEPRPVTWRRPVRSLRQAAASLRHDDPASGDGSDDWRAHGAPELSEEEQRAVGSEQLARWRGGRAPAGEEREGDPAPPRPTGDPVVRPITPSTAEFDETEWRWLDAAATSHLARRDTSNGHPGEQSSEPAQDGTSASSSS